MSFFELIHKEKHTRARLGVIHTVHGDIATPAFMPVGTQASVKTLDQTDLELLGAQIILGNTYHLHLRPGEDLIAKMGGLHKFMNWNKPILTDSGGFQVFSLNRTPNPRIYRENREHNYLSRISRYVRGFGVKSNQVIDPKQNNERTISPLVKIDEDGVTFRSHLDGSTHRFTPESSIEIQRKLGADIIMAFDECTPDEADYEYTKQAMKRTHRWAERSLAARHSLPTNNLINQSSNQHLFGIIQGARHKELREESARFICDLDFDGIAVGGESIGYNMEATKEILDWVYPILPKEKPHYAMGLGLSPLDIFEVVERGIDMFDCVAPTRLARHGMVYVFPPSPQGDARLGEASARRGPGVRSNHRLDLTNSTFSRDPNHIDASCSCPTCSRYSRAYIHHLFRAGEISAMRLATIHNLHFFLELMRQIREAIKEDKLVELKKRWK